MPVIWAAAFDRGAPPIAHKRILGRDAFEDRSSADGFDVRIGDAELSHGRCRGQAGPLAWDLRFEAAERAEPHLPAWLDRLPLPTHARHAHPRTRFSGTFRVGTDERVLTAAPGLQVHLFGRRRVQELYWIASPPEALEVSAVRASARRGLVRQPAVGALRLGDLALGPFGIHTERVGAAGLEARARDRRNLARVRAYAPPAQFVGYAYRDPGGRDVSVAQCDVANAFVEHFERAHRLARWRLSRELRVVEGAALELHEPSPPIASVPYARWDEETVATRAPSPALRFAWPARVAGLTGQWLDVRAPSRVIALGVTYAGHAREVGERADAPVVFEKSAASFAAGARAVRIPSPEALLGALRSVEPGIDLEIARRLGWLPALLDYEVELGLVLLEDVPRNALRRGTVPRMGFVVAGDMTARSVQLLGEGRPDRLRYWAAAKSFVTFLPCAPRMFVPDTPSARFPDVLLSTQVNGALRQRASAREIVLDVPAALSRAAETLRTDLRAGDLVLTGTPGGVALGVPRWKRALADRLFDRFGKVERVIDAYARSDAFLRPGDEVVLDAGPLGRCTLRVEISTGATPRASPGRA